MAKNIVLGVNEYKMALLLVLLMIYLGSLKSYNLQLVSMLGLPNPNSINWTLVVSSQSDSAACQKLMNRLIEDCHQLSRQLMSLKHSVPCIWVLT